MPATSLFILYRRIGTTTYTYGIITVRTMTQGGDTMTMMIHAIVRNDTAKRVEIFINTIKADATTVITKGVAMTSIEASTRKVIMTKKIEEISSV